MWSDEIDYILSDEKNFCGCYALDTLPIPPSFGNNCSFIINTSYSFEEGDHWVAIVMRRKECFYFDSFGLPIISKEIMKFLSSFPKVTYSNVCIQNISSHYCGQFSIAFVKMVKSRKSYINFLFKFNHVNLNKNDIRVEKILYSILSKSNLSRLIINKKYEKMNKAPTSVLIPSSSLINKKTLQLGRGKKNLFLKIKRNSSKRRKSRKLKKRTKKKRKINHGQRRRKTITHLKSI